MTVHIGAIVVDTNSIRTAALIARQAERAIARKPREYGQGRIGPARIRWAHIDAFSRTGAFTAPGTT